MKLNNQGTGNRQRISEINQGRNRKKTQKENELTRSN